MGKDGESCRRRHIGERKKAGPLWPGTLFLRTNPYPRFTAVHYYPALLGWTSGTSGTLKERHDNAKGDGGRRLLAQFFAYPSLPSFLTDIPDVPEVYLRIRRRQRRLFTSARWIHDVNAVLLEQPAQLRQL